MVLFVNPLTPSVKLATVRSERVKSDNEDVSFNLPNKVYSRCLSLRGSTRASGENFSDKSIRFKFLNKILCLAYAVLYSCRC